MELRRGDLIEVRWVDIEEDATGNPDTAKLETRSSVGYFWRGSESVFVTTMTMDEGLSGQNGYCIYPLGVVAGVKVIRRGRGKVYSGGIPYVYSEPPSSGKEGGDPTRSRRPKKQRGAPALRGSDLPEQPDVPEVPKVG